MQQQVLEVLDLLEYNQQFHTFFKKIINEIRIFLVQKKMNERNEIY